MQKNNFLQLDEVIETLIQKHKIEKKLRESQALNEWHSVVGARIDRISKPVKISDGKLFVEVSNTSWRTELMLMRPQIKHKINERIGKKILKDIVFF